MLTFPAAALFVRLWPFEYIGGPLIYYHPHITAAGRAIRANLWRSAHLRRLVWLGIVGNKLEHLLSIAAKSLPS